MDTMNDMLNDWSTTKSYATRENLAKGLAKVHLAHIPHIVVRTPERRWTAIFAKSFLENAGIQIMAPVWAGFRLVG